VTLKFNFLASNKMSDQDLSCTIYMPNFVVIYPVVCVLRVLTYAHTCTEPLTGDYVGVNENIIYKRSPDAAT